MKLKSIIASISAVLLMAVGCQPAQQFDVLGALKVSEDVVSLPQDGGTVSITVSAEDSWKVTESSRWITVSPLSGNAGETELTFTVLKSKKTRNGEVVIASGENEKYIKLTQFFEDSGNKGPREFVKVNKVQPNKLYLLVFQKDGKPHVMGSVTSAGVSGGYNYGYGTITALADSEISADGSKITLNHQDNSFLLRKSGDGFTMQYLSGNIYLGNNSGYSSISYGDDTVPGAVWNFEALADGTMKVKNGSMWMHFSSKYGNIELTAADPAGDLPVLYEDTQDPDLPEMTWDAVTALNVTATTASLAASFTYNGIEPLDGAGFIVKSKDKEIKIPVELKEDSNKFSYEIKADDNNKLVPDTDYTVTAYLNYEGLTSKSEAVAFKTKSKDAKTITVAKFVEILKGMEVSGKVSLSAVPYDYVEGIVTAVNGENQNLYKGLTLEDGTGQPNTGIFLYATQYNNAFAPGTKVKLALADAFASDNNGLLQIVEGDLTEVSKNNAYTLAKFSADTIDFADYVGMYVTVVDAKCASAVGTKWNDGKNSDAYVDFTSKDGKVEFTARTYKTCPWAKEIVGVKSTGEISGVVQVAKDEYSILPNKPADVAAFANTDPEITAVSETSLTWSGFDITAMVLDVTGERLKGLSAGVDNNHWTVSINGNKVSVIPNEANVTEKNITGVLTINAVGGNSATVQLTHVNLPMGKGAGTEDDPYDIIKAWRLANALGNTGETLADVYVQGTVSRINELSTQYGNATYYITDEKGTLDFYVYRGKNVGNTNFTSSSQLKVGDKVLLFGSLANYKGTSPQLGTGNYIVKFFDASEDEGDDDPTTIVLDVTENAPHADFPVGERIAATLKTYNINGYDWSFYAPGYFTYFNDTHVVLLGKAGAYITLPAVEGKALKSIAYLASEGASSSVELGVFEGDSTTSVAGGESKVATKGETTTWTLSNTKEGVRYNLRVTNDKNTQFQKITLIYE